MAADEIQNRYFDFADRARFEWTVAGAGFADSEDDLLAPLRPMVASPLLEIGCGEGNNLVRLRDTGPCFGVDLYAAKVAFARGAVAGVDFAAADAAALPFASGMFRTVFIRDLLHHVPDPRAVAAEALRVLGENGRLLLIEPNGRNPLVHLQSRLIPAERAAREFSTAHVASLLAGLPLVDLQLSTAHPLPLRRLVFHYKMGLPALATLPAARTTLAAVERWLGCLLPASRWEHVIATARKQSADTSGAAPTHEEVR